MANKKETKEPREKKKKLPPGVRERDGRYTYRYSVEVIVDGKPRRKQKETPAYPTAQAAYEAGVLIKAQQLQGKLVDQKDITLGSWCERWIKDYIVERESRKHTVRNRETAFVALKKYFGEHKRLKDITPDDYQQYLNNLKKEGYATKQGVRMYSRGTIQEYHTSAQMLFADAVRKKIIAENPTEHAVLPAFKQTVEEIEAGEIEIPLFLEKNQLLHLLSTLRFRGNPQDYEFFLVLAYTGLRIGELLALKVADFDEKAKTISVTKTLTVVGSVKNYEIGPPKNKSSIRKVAIGETVIKAIKSQLLWREQKIKNNKVLHDGDFIFWSNKFPGYPASSSYLGEQFKKMLTLANLPTSLTPHSLRHTHVSLLAAAGEQLAVIQHRMGHKNDEITKRVYLHVTEGQRKAVPDRFEQIMNS